MDFLFGLLLDIMRVGCSKVIFFRSWVKLFERFKIFWVICLIGWRYLRMYW